MCSARSNRGFFAARLCLGALPLLAAGCVSMEVPDDFVVTTRFLELKAVTADDAKLWVRDFGDSLHAGSDFWKRALKAELVENRGYTFLEEEGARDGDGNEGWEMVFEVTAEGVPQRYLVAVFVYEGFLFFADTVTVVEFLAPTPLFERYAADVRTSIGTLGG